MSKGLLESLPRGKPRFVEPMKAKLDSFQPRGRRWLYEIKFDGVRALAIKEGESVELISRNRKDLSLKYPGVVSALRKLPCREIVLDGEVVALDESGRSSFQLLQRVNQPSVAKPDLFYYAFDLLNLDGRDTTGLPLLQRKALLKKLIKGKTDCLRFSDALPGSLEEVTAQLQRYGLEGIIAKEADSLYEIGTRSGSWVKIKWATEQEFVIGGFTDPEGARKFFGSVLVGYYEGSKLLYASKVGTGFDERKLRSLYQQFQKLSRADCPFANLPEPRNRSGRQGLTASQMRFCHWVEPRLVCQVRFTEWTDDGHLRQPVFLGLREDKEPGEVVRERVA